MVLERLHNEARRFLRRLGRRPGFLPCHQQLLVPLHEQQVNFYHDSVLQI
jgi:hypothetical protein